MNSTHYPQAGKPSEIIVGATKNISLQADLTYIDFSATGASTVTVLNKPIIGMRLVARQTATGTNAHKVALPVGCTFDGANRFATLDAQGEEFMAEAVSEDRFVLLRNGCTFGTS